MALRFTASRFLIILPSAISWQLALREVTGIMDATILLHTLGLTPWSSLTKVTRSMNFPMGIELIALLTKKSILGSLWEAFARKPPNPSSLWIRNMICEQKSISENWKRSKYLFYQGQQIFSKVWLHKMANPFVTSMVPIADTLTLIRFAIGMEDF